MGPVWQHFIHKGWPGSTPDFTPHWTLYSASLSGARGVTVGPLSQREWGCWVCGILYSLIKSQPNQWKSSSQRNKSIYDWIQDWIEQTKQPIRGFPVTLVMTTTMYWSDPSYPRVWLLQILESVVPAASTWQWKHGQWICDIFPGGFRTIQKDISLVKYFLALADKVCYPTTRLVWSYCVAKWPKDFVENCQSKISVFSMNGLCGIGLTGMVTMCTHQRTTRYWSRYIISYIQTVSGSLNFELEEQPCWKLVEFDHFHWTLIEYQCPPPWNCTVMLVHRLKCAPSSEYTVWKVHRFERAWPRTCTVLRGTPLKMYTAQNWINPLPPPFENGDS